MSVNLPSLTKSKIRYQKRSHARPQVKRLQWINNTEKKPLCRHQKFYTWLQADMHKHDLATFWHIRRKTHPYTHVRFTVHNTDRDSHMSKWLQYLMETSVGVDPSVPC